MLEVADKVFLETLGNAVITRAATEDGDLFFEFGDGRVLVITDFNGFIAMGWMRSGQETLQ